MDFAELDYKEFELLVALLLARTGFCITRTPNDDSPFSPDFEAIAPDNALAFVEVKHFRRSARLPMSVFDQFLGELDRLRAQHPTARGILVTSGKLTSAAENVAQRHGHIQVWDGGVVATLLLKHPDIGPVIERARSHRAELVAQMDALKSGAAPAPTRSAVLLRQLRSVSPGRDDWKEYERVGAQLLTDLFTPHLGAPEIQSRSEDGLDIMDAIYPIRASVPPWSLVRSEYQSRFIVAEFKNYTEVIGQRQVESIAQYLWKKAHRSFGLLLSRKGPDDSALAARRRAWVENDKLIVFLDDEDLADMAQLWEEDDDPFQVIDAQLEDFLRRLSP